MMNLFALAISLSFAMLVRSNSAVSYQIKSHLSPFQLCAPCFVAAVADRRTARTLQRKQKLHEIPNTRGPLPPYEGYSTIATSDHDQTVM